MRFCHAEDPHLGIFDIICTGRRFEGWEHKNKLKEGRRNEESITLITYFDLSFYLNLNELSMELPDSC